MGNKEVTKDESITEEKKEKCFVIMPISDQGDYPSGHFTKVYEQIIKPAILSAGYEPYRVDENKISDSIIDKIFDAIQNCPMAVCDLSNNNPNVMYELGLRQAYDKPVVLIKDEKTNRVFDISAIDFDLLRREFAKVKKKNLVLKDLEEVIQQKLDSILFANPDRINYYERYQQIIDDYNSEQDRATIEKTFMELMDLANQMSQEEQRYVREGFTSDEELSLYDMLFRDDLSKTDIKKLKEVAASLLQKIKNKLAEFDHWTDKQETKAAIDNLIRDTLWAELPECYDEVSISRYRQQIYEYVYTRYRTVA